MDSILFIIAAVAAVGCGLNLVLQSIRFQARFP
jgi:hypothetical protein